MHDLARPQLNSHALLQSWSHQRVVKLSQLFVWSIFVLSHPHAEQYGVMYHAGQHTKTQRLHVSHIIVFTTAKVNWKVPDTSSDM